MVSPTGLGVIGDIDAPVTETVTRQTATGARVEALAAEARQEAAEKRGPLEVIQYALAGGTKGNNFISSFATAAYRKLNSPDISDPDFDVSEHLSELTQDIPRELWHRFTDAESMQDAQYIRDGILVDMSIDQELASAGWKGAGAIIAASLFDLDVLFPAMAVSKGSRVVRAAKTAAYAGASNVVTEAALTTVKENDYHDVAAAGIAGLGFGAALGGALPANSLAKFSNEITDTAAAKASDEFDYKARDAFTVPATGTVGVD